MATFAVYIEKEMSFRGGPNRFGNTYHFAEDTADPFLDGSAVNAVADAEAAMLPVDVTLVRGMTWGPTDGPEFENVMRDSIELDRPGENAGGQAGFYRTGAVLVSWPLPRSPQTNRRRWLRKFIRPCDAVITDLEALAGTAPIPQADRDFIIQNYAEPVRSVGLAVATLATADGTQHNGDPFVSQWVTQRQVDK